MFKRLKRIIRREPKPGYYWHVHHDVLLEYCYNYGERVAFIIKNKDKAEIPTRLRVFRRAKISPPLFEMLQDAFWDYNFLTKSEKKALEQVDALHKKQCVKDCPWNGKTIFPNA